MAHLIEKYNSYSSRQTQDPVKSELEMATWGYSGIKGLKTSRTSSINGAIAAYGTLPSSSRSTPSTRHNLLSDLYATITPTKPIYTTSPRLKPRRSILPPAATHNPHNAVRNSQQFGTDVYYMTKISDVLGRPTMPMFTSSPSRVTDYMFIGGYNDADNWPYLRRLGVTHVLNMAGPRRSTMNPYPPASGIVAYEMVDADDSEYYDVMQHFSRAKAFIDRAKYSGGKVLVHCAMGINRSGAMCCAYLMAEEKLSLLDAMYRMKHARGMVLCNRSFQKQLLKFARQKGHL